MIEFNSTHIIVGQIKEILSTFNLPSYRIYTKENQEYFDKYGVEKDIIPTIKRTLTDSGFPAKMQYNPYIKNNTIQYYIAKEQEGNSEEKYKYNWEKTSISYAANIKDVNNTKNLIIKNNFYDYYTHEYLGNYLRFKRDYENIDLMPLYNCFGNRICNSLNYSWETITKTGEKLKINFNSDNTSFKIYMLPVKLFRQYTIAIDCSAPVEICCGIFGKYQDTREKVLNIPAITYKKYNNIIFGQPVIYDLLTTIADQVSPMSLSDLASCEQDLKMFIKIPANINSSIVVLEGDYRRYNDSILKFTTINSDTGTSYTTLNRTQNHTITNFDLEKNDFTHFKPITALQLLRINTKVSYPFADRLIEYLLENVVDQNEEILDNIRRTQKVIDLNNAHAIKIPVWDKEQGKFIEKPGKLNKNLTSAERGTVGLWDPAIRPIVYERFNNIVKANNNDTNHDILGYIDKDIEHYYEASTGNKTKINEDITVTISSIDLYTTKAGLYSDLGEDDE